MAVDSRNSAVAKALAGSPVMVFFVSADGLFEWIENIHTAWTVEQLVGEPTSRLFDEDALAFLQRCLSQPSDETEGNVAEITTRGDLEASSNRRILKITARRHTSDKDGREGLLCTSVDITEERARIETQRVLLLEVAHRSKNMLAMVLSVAAQTARATPDVSTFLRRFTGRVQSMAKSQDSITDTDWKGVNWRNLVEQQVTNVVQLGSARIAVEGGDVLLTPNASTHIGLALHELVTFSLTSGSLSQREGAVSLTLDATGDELRMIWSDEASGAGPAFHDIDRFSRTLLERVVPSALSGEATIDIKDDSVRYEVSIGAADYKHI